ncbi:hypothetical protein Lfu02_02690 [Longispora fulva]|uniref:Peptidase C51 domain-containing protein n=1 Tax=Longispora fulva TaxID=619741 RepID=A0A8J7KI60_9ACTN|nr:CHAP domain-containing protein [Longispora fulva]MBG6135859.1 hypothetical protein [Longispora fulva]GIG55897.1 hypothetical protein Lfu02_02690 [Longispora fulva]
MRVSSKSGLGRRIAGALLILAASAGITAMSAAPAMADTRSGIVDTARGQLGHGPCSPSYYSSCGEDWCADFAKWVWAQNGVNVTGLNPMAASFRTYGINNGTWHPLGDGYVPQLGDAIMFDYNGTGISHVALVQAVRSVNDLTEIGGNQGTGNWSANRVTEYRVTPSAGRVVGYTSPAGIPSSPPPVKSTPIAVGSDGTQMILTSGGTVLAKQGVGLYGWTVETDPGVKAIATNGGVQLILTADGTVLAKEGIGLYGWTVESDPGITAIAVGGDGTQLILDASGTVWAKKGVGLYGWTQETDAVVKAIAVGTDGTQMILAADGTVLAKQGIGLYGWTVESDAVVKSIATNGGVQVALAADGTVLAKQGIGLYGWTVESDPGITAIAVGSDGTQLIRDGSGQALAKSTIGLYGWTLETDAVVAAVATNAGVQLILDNSGHVSAKQAIGLYGWTLESDPIS